MNASNFGCRNDLITFNYNSVLFLYSIILCVSSFTCQPVRAELVTGRAHLWEQRVQRRVCL